MGIKKSRKPKRPEHLTKTIRGFWDAVIVHDMCDDTMNCFSQFRKDYQPQEQIQLAIQYAYEVDELILKVLRCADSNARKALIASQPSIIRALLMHRCDTVITTLDNLENSGMVGYLWPEFLTMTYCLLVLTRSPYKEVGLPAAIPDR